MTVRSDFGKLYYEVKIQVDEKKCAIKMEHKIETIKQVTVSIKNLYKLQFGTIKVAESSASEMSSYPKLKSKLLQYTLVSLQYILNFCTLFT